MHRCLLLALVAALGLARAADPVTARFRETDALLQNPGQGWMCRPSATDPRFPCSVVYLRFIWADAEPAEGRYDWSVLDGPIAAARAKGRAIAFRVMTTNAHSRGYYSSPKWLFDLGCRSFEYLRGGDDPTFGGVRIPRIEPDYTDPLYLAKHAAFIRALGARYDGHPGVEFIDVGSYGIWGEWHTPHPAPWEVRRQIIDMYLAAFRRTPLVMMSDDAQAMAYGLPRGAGFRRDGVGSPSHEQSWIGSAKYKDVPGFAEAWQRAPAVFEWYGDYAYLQKRAWSFDRAVAFMLANHVTLINDNVGAVPDEAMPQLRDLARRAGYRFVLREVSHAPAVRRGRKLTVEMRWSNTGVGRLYREFPLEVYLLDSAGRVAARVRAAADPRTWLPGDHTATATVEVPAKLARGDYGLAVALVDGEGRAAIRLAIDARETDRMYRVSEVRVE
jgi:hypothetical protein